MRTCEEYFIGSWLGRFTSNTDEPNTGVRLLIFEACGIVRFPQFYGLSGKRYRVFVQDGVWRADKNNLYVRWLDDDDDEEDGPTRVVKGFDWFAWKAYAHTYRYCRVNPRPVFYALPLVSHTDDTGLAQQGSVEQGSLV